ncbi:hypothetical protein KAJ77_08710, partial [bacterium]|nr:hypothetical protein [bacterium]
MLNPRCMFRFSTAWIISILLICCSSILVSQTQELPPEVLSYADIVLYNGQVLTMDRDQPPINVTQAVAVRDGRILAVGEDDRILQMAGPNTLQVDLQGKAVMPGVVDTHSHPNSYALFHRDWAREVNQAYVQFLRENDVHYTNVRWDSKENALADLKTFAQRVPDGVWIYTKIGIDETIYPILTQITRYDLDKSVPDNP